MSDHRRRPRLPAGPSRRFTRRLAVLAAPLLALSLTVALNAAPAQADPPAALDAASAQTEVPAAQTGAPTAPAGSATPGDGQTVTTLTGGKILIRPDGTQEDQGGGPALNYSGPNGDHYVVPAEAAPYAGRSLDWTLFDVSALVRDHVTDGARIPVALSFSSAGASAPPGITLTSSGSGISAVGYMTPASAQEFGAYLRGRIAADVAAGRPAGTTALPGVNRLALAAAAPGQGVTPQYAYQVAQFDTPGLTGQANAIIRLWDMDSFTAVSTTIASSDGIARIALPAGRYFAVAQFGEFDDQGNPVELRYVSAGFTVPDSSGTVTTVNLDEKSATTRSTAATPRPARQINQTVAWGLQSATGDWDIISTVVEGAKGTDIQGEPGTDVYVAPTSSGPPAGKLRYFVQWDGIAPSSRGDFPYAGESAYPYRYDLAFGWDDRIPKGPYPVRNRDLATVHEHLYADPAQTPADFEFSKAPIDPVLPAEFAAIQTTDGLPREAPGDFTDYVGTADGGDWIFNADIGPGYGLDETMADPRTYAGGHVYATDWGRGPLSPQWGQHLPRPDALYQNCEACVTENAGEDYLTALYPADAQDTQQAASGVRYLDESGACYVNGQLFAGYPACIDDHALSADSGTPAEPNTYRLVYDTSLRPTLPLYSQATSTHTDLTFRFAYKAQPPADMALPSGYQCTEYPVQGACEILPVLTLGYQLDENELNTSSAPVQQLKLDVGHLTYDGIGSHAAITSASVDVSFDGGTTWQHAVAGGRDGHYTAHWRNPASARGTSPALRVTATDADGGSITQVIDNAYTLAAHAR
ncbi:hypothetical protein SAMN05216223_13352 [Actinacidiphila yanglinensis]|uniref:Uncharacterized protein n=1 Tax=Actinacidiphila yanglinensis TaxID=310779 RepID=A0A1H6EC56_9ACTN|nr:hypothetical protein [Actinacidiphila yanglinensis]SEG95418.1 hypothetical protein SAMN05216223_13352 [Actinacidiphila yanglinensis]